MSANNRPRILILGAGFAGVAVAQELVRLLPKEEHVDITIVDQNNFFLFTPMLGEVVGGEVDASDIAAAVRSLSPRVTFEQGRVDAIDVANKRVTLTMGRAEWAIPEVQRTLHADHLVIALGSVTNFHGIEGLPEHSCTIKSVDEAAAIRNRVLTLLERADEEPDRDSRRALLTFVVGGGGFSGVETMAALNDLVRASVSRYAHVTDADIRTILVHPENRLLPEIDEGLAWFAKQKLQQRGVEILFDTRVTGAGQDYVEVKGSRASESRKIPAHTLIWAGGITPSPVIGSAGIRLGHHHGIIVDSCCAIPGSSGAWALGDCAEIPQPGADKTYAPTAQNATREGKQVARNIVALLHGQKPQPFIYRPIGELAIVGKRSGVASLYGMQFSGLLAWAMWRAVYLAKLPGLAQRFRVGLAWLLDLAFGREIAVLTEAGGAGNPRKSAGGKEAKQGASSTSS